MKWICILDIAGEQYYTRTIQPQNSDLFFYDYLKKEEVQLPCQFVNSIFPSERNDIT